MLMTILLFDMLFRSESTYDIDEKALKRQFLKLQQVAHPDSYSNAAEVSKKKKYTHTYSLSLSLSKSPRMCIDTKSTFFFFFLAMMTILARTQVR